MKSLLKLAAAAIVLYVAWDMFGGSMMQSLEDASAKAKNRIGDVITTEDAADFVVRYDAPARRFTVTASHDPRMAERATMEQLAASLKSSPALVPHVRVVYDASVFSDSAEQAGFEDAVRRQVTRANARVSFAASGRPRSY